MRHLLSANDRIHWTGLNAERAADASGLIDASDLLGCGVGDIAGKWQHGSVELVAELFDERFSARRTAIDGGTLSNGFGVRSATRVATLCALGLRQHLINKGGQRLLIFWVTICSPNQQQHAKQTESGKGQSGADHELLDTPTKPMNASAMMPADTMWTATPWKGFGTVS